HLGVQQKAIRYEHIPQLADNFMYTIEGLSVQALLGGLTEQHVDGQFELMKGTLLLQSALNAPLPARPLRVLVTAGDTSERIDAVRKIVNPATGRLGSLTADMFAMTGARVTYVCGQNAKMPAQEMEAVYTIESVEELDAVIGRVVAEGKFDCIVHSMAVSEYTLRRITTAHQLAADLSRVLEHETPRNVKALVRETLCAADAGHEGKRLPPNRKDLVMVMDPAPNIMAKMRTAQPAALLIGFLLLVGVTRETLVGEAKKQLRREGCDYVLANDMEDIGEAHHRAVLVAAGGGVSELNTKQEIAQAIVKCALSRE
ncbi:MAG: phosphopantothenoylcysteine decarboxylase, partial [Oscillospiraceae bacterium]